MGVVPVRVSVKSLDIGVANEKGVNVASEKEVGVGAGGEVPVGVSVGMAVRIGILVGVEVGVAVGWGERVAVGSGVGIGVRVEGSGVGTGVGVRGGGNVGSETVGTNVGSIKTDTGSPLTSNAPANVPKTTNTRAGIITHLPRSILTYPRA